LFEAKDAIPSIQSLGGSAPPAACKWIIRMWEAQNDESNENAGNLGDAEEAWWAIEGSLETSIVWDAIARPL